MLLETIRRLMFAAVLCLVQALLLSRIRLFGCAVPMLFVYFVVTTRRGYPRGLTLLWSFLLGLGIDIFANTPGLNAASTTFTGFLQPYLIEMFLPRDADNNMAASARQMGWGKFTAYTTLVVMLFCITLFSLEAFRLPDLSYWALSAGGAFALTMAMILTCELLRKK